MRTSEPESRISVLITLIGIMIVIAPLCGYLFSCRCNWPWSGLMEHCNFFDPQVVRPCPFCEHLALSIPLLSGIALISLVATKSGISRILESEWSLILDSLGGLSLFLVLTVIAGSLF
ncbi:MAG: hypothetical protein ACRESZ_08720 [Methylococcales bacterium]